MEYKTFNADDELSPFIKCYWTLTGEETAPAVRQIIVPDGCMEMIFHYGDLYLQHSGDNNSTVQPRCFVIGQLTRPLEIEPTGRTDIFSVRFHPEGFAPFSSMPVKRMENTAVSLKLLFNADGEAFEKEMLGTDTVEQKIKVAERFLSAHLMKSEKIDMIIKSTVDLIINVGGDIHVGRLASDINVSRRKLERSFASAIGLSPKQLSKTIRLQSALQKLLKGEHTSLTTLAYAGEFYDQSHFIKDFKHFTGVTPREFYGDSLQMSSLFYGS